MNWLRLTLLTIGGLLLIAVAGIAFLLSNPQQLRYPVAGLVSGLLERQLEINGDFDVEFGRILRLHATELRIANPDWIDEGDFLRVDEVHASIDLATVLDGPLILTAVSARSVELNLLQDEERRDNWTFGTDDGPGDDDSDGDDDAGPAFLIQQIDLADVLIFVSLPALDDAIRFDIESLTQRPRDDGLLDAQLVGKLGGKPVRLGGQLGPFANLLQLNDIQLDLSGQFDSLALSANGRVDDLISPAEPELVFRLSGPDVRDVAEMLGLGRAGEGGVELKGELRPTEDGVVAEIGGQLGRTRIDLSARSAVFLEFENASVDVDLEAPNLGRLLALFGIDDLPEEPFTLAGQVNRSGALLTISDLALGVADARFALNGSVEEFPDLDGVRLQLDIQGDDIARFREILRLPGVASGPFEAAGAIDVTPEGADLLDVRFKTALVDLQMAGPIGDPPDYVGTRLRVVAQGDNFRALADALEIPDQREVSYEIVGELEITEEGIQTREPTVLRLGEQRLALNGLIGLKPLVADTDVRFRLYGNSTDALAELLDLQEGTADAAYDVSGRFRARSEGFRLDEIDGQIGEAKFGLAGLITRDPDLIGSELRFDLSGPDLEQLLADSELLDVPSGPFRMSGTVARRRNSILVSGFEAAGGRATLTAELDVGWPLDEKSSGEFAITVDGPDLAAVFPELDNYQPDAAPFAARAQGSWDQGLWTIDNYVSQIGSASLSGSGSFDQPPDIVRTDFALTLTVPDLSELGRFGGERLPPEPLDLNAHFTDEANRFVFDRLDGRLAEGSFTGRLVLDFGKETPEVEIDLRSPLLDLKPFLADPDEVQAAEVEGEPDSAASDGRVIPDLPLPLEQLARLNARADIEIEKLRLRTQTLEDIIVDGYLRDGALRLEQLEAYGPSGGGLYVATSLVPGEGGAETTLTVRGEQLRLNLFRATGENVDKLPITDFTVELAGRGDDLRQLAASLNGSARFEAKGGRIPNNALRFLTGDFLLQVIETLNPFVRQDPYTEISCVAVLLDATDGLVTTAPAVVLQTDKLNVFADGRVNLKDERQNFSIRTAPRRGITISISEVINPFFKVAGTLGEPALTLDPTRATVSGTAAVLTAGLSILAKAAWDRAFRAADPCAAAIDRADSLKSD